MSEPVREKARTLQDDCNRLIAEHEQLLGGCERLLNESKHLRAGSERLCKDSERLGAQYKWLRRRFTAAQVAVGLETEDGRRLRRHHWPHDARPART
jgi:hypothetical protein